MKNKPVLSTVLSVNPYTNSYYSGTPTQIESILKPKFQKNQYTLSYLKTASVLTTRVEISKNIDALDRHDVIENKTYEELGLDIATEYFIDYYERTQEEDDTTVMYQVFAVDPHDIETTFASTVESIKYVDQIYPVALLPKALYAKEILSSSGVDCFVYFTTHEAFLTLYKDGEFLYTKALAFTLEVLHETFCEIYGEKVSFENFRTLLIDEGLRTTNEENREYLIKLFNDLSTQINDVLIYAKRAYELDVVSKLFIGTSLGIVYGMHEYLQTTLGVEALDFDFEYGFETQEFYVDQLHQLLHLTSHLAADERYACNFTLFNRPPPFLQRQSGRLLTLAASALLVTSLYPLFNVSYALFAKLENDALMRTQKQRHEERAIREQQVILFATKRDELNTKIKEALAIQAAQKQVLAQIHTKKVGYPMKAKIIADLTQDLNAHKVQLRTLTYDDTHHGIFTLDVIAPKERHITDMVETLTRTKQALYEISLEEIAYSTTLGTYTCNLKVGLR